MTSAEIDNGLLHVDLLRPRAEARIQKIKINKASKAPTRGAGKAINLEIAD